jgi:hypothetical protein
VKEDIVNLWNKQKGLCALAHKPMDLSAPPRHPTRPSLDRIDIRRGYHFNNVRLVWHFVNQARNDFTDEVFLKYCKIIAAE